MRMEFGGTGNKTPIQVYEPQHISDYLLEKIETFRFPQGIFSSNLDRENEIKIDRIYNNRSVFIIYFSPLSYDTIIACARIIAKNSIDEKLPIEYAKIDKIGNFSSDIPPVILSESQTFKIISEKGTLPVCEIGGLRAAEVNSQTEISLKLRYRALDSVMQECDRQVHDRGFKSFFLTCKGTPQMQRLYHDKYFFNEIAQITYNGKDVWKALWRLPFKNPKKTIRYQIFC
jgi:hypothetical protein